MNRPRLFLSAVTEELRHARQTVSATARNLGFDPVSQDDFPTGHGELRQWLREQLDSCEGLIQLVGQGYGAEPSEVDPLYGRVSYTQLEFLYARKHGKKTWIIVIGKDFSFDKPADQLDLPGDSDHSDPTGYQVERKALQQDYIARLKKDNHLRHTANNDTELQNIILRLRDDLGELRKQWKEWLEKDAAFKARTTVHLAEAGRLTTEKIRAHLLQTTEDTHRRELAEAEAGPIGSNGSNSAKPPTMRTAYPPSSRLFAPAPRLFASATVPISNPYFKAQLCTKPRARPPRPAPCTQKS